MDSPQKTTWNSDLFSETLDNPKEGFHTIELKQKIKRSKKQKGQRPVSDDNNLKNIETFDTLDNTTPNVGKEGYVDNTDTTCEDNPDYEGCDNGDKKRKPNDPRQQLIDFINDTYRWFDSKFFIIAFYVSVALGQSASQIDSHTSGRRRLKNGNRNNKQGNAAKQYSSMMDMDVSKFTYLPEFRDVQIVKKYVEGFFAIMISCYAIYHVFFLFFYKHELYYKDGVELKDISLKKLREDAKLSFYSIESVFLFFFQFAWWYVESFEYYFVRYFTTPAKKYLNATLCFIIMFVGLVLFYYYYPGILRTMFIDILRMNLNNKTVNFLYIVFIVLIFMDWFNGANYLPDGPVYYKYLLTIIIRLIILCILTIPFVGIYFFLYVAIYSLFGIFIYAKPELGYYKLFDTLRKYAENTKHQIRIGTDCSPNTFFEKIMITINVIMDFLYTYLFYLAFLVLFMFSFYDYAVNIHSSPLKNGLLVMTGTLIAMVSSFCINSFRVRASGKFAAHPEGPVPEK
jgi:hypothetical protein